jgi:ABC-2 type transport system ATP-binding protein
MINIQNLNFSYKKQEILFQDLSLKLHTGSIVGLLGKNGAGKTTLLRLIAGLLFPVSGRLEVMSHQPKKREPSFLEGVSFIPEDFYLPNQSIKNYIRANSPFYPRFDMDLLNRLLKDFGLSNDSSILKLSHGQKKKFLIAFALASKCRLMIMDEPTNGLDIPSKAIFRKIIAGALDEDQLVIISTHQVKDVENLIDKIVILDKGKIIMQKDMMDISGKLNFLTASSPNGDHVLYSEIVPGGYKIITRSINESSNVDIELLFNAVISNNQIMEKM